MKKIFFILTALVSTTYLASCSKKAETTTDLSGKSSFYGFLDGFSLSCLEGQYGSAGRNTLILPIDTDSSKAAYSSYLSNQNMTLSLTKGMLRYPAIGGAPLTYFKAYFPVASIDYADTSNFNGMQISYIDYQGETWSTAWGSQKESFFTINSVEDSKEAAKLTIKVDAKFKCRIYNKKGAMHVLTGTKFVGYFDNL